MENQNYQQNKYEDEISIKELLITLWNGKKIILAITIGLIILSAMHTFFIAEKVYEATSELIVQKTEEVSTRYGNYEFPSENPKDYIYYIKSNEVLKRVLEKEGLDLTVEKLDKKIKIKQDKEAFRFIITTSANGAKKSQEINNALVDIFIKMQRVVYKKYAIEKFINDYEDHIYYLTNEIQSQESLLKERRKLLSSISPIYTLQKSLFNDPKTAAAYADKFDLDLNKLSQAMLVEEEAREVYLKIEEICVDTEKELIDAKQNLKMSNDKLEELIIAKEEIDVALKNNDFESVLNGAIDVFENKIMVVSLASEPQKPISPKKALNLVVGAMLGVILGVFTALFMAYWKNN